jgi:phosphohistidine phosphatase
MPPPRSTTGRTLWLLRHAKTVADPPSGGTDFDRVLAPRGRRDATALGELFAGSGQGLPAELKRAPRPQIALVSPAARTTATAELVFKSVTHPPELRFEDGLYQAGPDDVLAALQALPDEVTAAMVVGHNPTAHALSQGLIRAGDKKGHTLAVRAGFPTCALGVYAFKVETWSEVEAHGAKLVALLTPPFGGGA